MGVERTLSEVRRHFSNWAAVGRDVEDVFRFESWWEIGPRCEALREIANACRSVGLEEEAAVRLGWAGHEGDEEPRRECADLVNHGVVWLRKAAESGIDVDVHLRYEYADRGEPDAQVRLGHLYVERRGVPRDPVTGESGGLDLASASPGSWVDPRRAGVSLVRGTPWSRESFGVAGTLPHAGSRYKQCLVGSIPVPPGLRPMAVESSAADPRARG